MSDFEESKKIMVMRTCPYRKIINKVKNEEMEQITIDYPACITYDCPFYNNKISKFNPTYCKRVNKEIEGSVME